MKYLKKYEAARGVRGKQIKTTPDNIEEILKDYKYHCDDMDEKSPITFEQFLNGLDFSMFSKHDYQDFNESGLNGPKDSCNNITVGNQTIYCSYDYGPYAPKGLDKSTDWCKRNSFIWAEVNTGGASGGSCWDTGDDDGAQPYDGNSLDLHDFIYSYLKPKLQEILSTQASTKTATELCDILYNNPGIIKEDSRRNNEYYGNYDDYECYYITLEDLFKFLYENEGF